jgi:hypothetical protein
MARIGQRRLGCEAGGGGTTAGSLAIGAGAMISTGVSSLLARGSGAVIRAYGRITAYSSSG